MKKILLLFMPFVYAFSLVAMEKQLSKQTNQPYKFPAVQTIQNPVPTWQPPVAPEKTQSKDFLQGVQRLVLQDFRNLNPEESRNIEQLAVTMSGKSKTTEEQDAEAYLAKLKKERVVRDSVASFDEYVLRTLFAPTSDCNMPKLDNPYEVQNEQVLQEVQEVLSKRVARKSNKEDVNNYLDRVKEQQSDERELLQFSANGKTGLVDEIIKTKEMIHATVFDSNGDTPFALAIKNGKLTTAQKHLDAGALINTVNKAGLSPWDYAKMNQSDQGVVKFLEKNNAKSGEEYRLRIFQTIEKKESTINELIELLDFCYPEMEDDQGNSLLSCAAKNGQENMVRLLVEAFKVPVNTSNHANKTPLDLAPNKVIKDFLLEKGALTGEQNEFKKRLFEAVDESDAKGESYKKFIALINSEEIKQWIAADSKDANKKLNFISRLVNARDGQLNTLLITAAKKGSFNIVQYLVESLKAEINAFNREGYTALHIASINNRFTIASYLEKKGGILYRLSGPCDTKELSIQLNGNENKARASMQLEKRQQDLQFRKQFEAELLDEAKKANLEKIKSLVENHNDILNTARDDQGHTALALVVKHASEETISKRLEVVHFLVQKGAKLNVLNDDGKSVLDLVPSDAVKIQAFLNGKGAVSADIIATKDRERATRKKCFDYAKRGDLASLNKIYSNLGFINKDFSTMRENDDDTLLIVAARYAQKTLVEALCDKYQVEVNLWNNVFNTALDVAATKEIKDILKSKGAFTFKELTVRGILFSNAVLGKFKLVESQLATSGEEETLLRFDVSSQKSLLLAVIEAQDGIKDKEKYVKSSVKAITDKFYKNSLRERKDELILALKKAESKGYSDTVTYLKSVLNSHCEGWEPEKTKLSSRSSHAPGENALTKVLTITRIIKKSPDTAGEGMKNRAQNGPLSSQQQLDLFIRIAERDELVSALEKSVDVATLRQAGNGDTGLHIAVRRNNHGLVAAIIKRIDPNVLNEEKETALDIAINHIRNPETIKLLEENGAMTSTELSKRHTALVCAKNRNLKELQVLIKENNQRANVIDASGFSLLHLATQAGDLPMVQYLVEQCGVKLLLLTKNNQSAFDVASDSTIKEYLKDKGCFGYELIEKRPRLIILAKKNLTSDFKDLADTLAPKDDNSPAGKSLKYIREEATGKTPLLIAVQNANLDLVNLLIDEYAVDLGTIVYQCEQHSTCNLSDACSTNDCTSRVNPKTPLDVACDEWFNNNERKQIYKNIIEKLTRHGAHLANYYNNEKLFGRNALTDEQSELRAAVEGGYLPLLEIILSSKKTAGRDNLSKLLNFDVYLNATLLDCTLKKVRTEVGAAKEIYTKIGQLLYDCGAYIHDVYGDTKLSWQQLIEQKQSQVRQPNLILKDITLNKLGLNGVFGTAADHKSPPPPPSMKFEEPPLANFEPVLQNKEWSRRVMLASTRSAETIVRDLRASTRIEQPVLRAITNGNGHEKQRSQSIIKQSILLKNVADAVVDLITAGANQTESEDDANGDGANRTMEQLFGYLGKDWPIDGLVLGKQSVLHYASKNGNVNLVKKLVLTKGANPSVLNEKKQTACECARDEFNTLLNDPQMDEHERRALEEAYGEIFTFLNERENLRIKKD